MSTYTIEREIEIEAPIDVVWRTITEPELIRTWFADVADVEARPGAVGSLTFRADSGAPHVVGITVVAADRPHRFSYRWVYPPGERATEANSTLVTFTLVADGDERTREPLRHLFRAWGVQLDRDDPRSEPPPRAHPATDVRSDVEAEIAWTQELAVQP